MTQPPGQQIQVDPTVVIGELQHLVAQLTSQFAHDLAVTRAALGAAQADVQRLTRIHDSAVLGGAEDPQPDPNLTTAQVRMTHDEHGGG